MWANQRKAVLQCNTLCKAHNTTIHDSSGDTKIIIARTYIMRLKKSFNYQRDLTDWISMLNQNFKKLKEHAVLSLSFFLMLAAGRGETRTVLRDQTHWTRLSLSLFLALCVCVFPLIPFSHELLRCARQNDVMCFASLCGYERSKWVYPHWQSVYFVRPCPSVTGENDSGFAGADIIVLGKCIGHF